MNIGSERLGRNPGDIAHKHILSGKYKVEALMSGSVYMSQSGVAFYRASNGYSARRGELVRTYLLTNRPIPLYT